MGFKSERLAIHKQGPWAKWRREKNWQAVLCRGGARPTIAIVMAISASVTLSIGELTIGVASLNLRVTCELKSTCRHVKQYAEQFCGPLHLSGEVPSCL